MGRTAQSGPNFSRTIHTGGCLFPEEGAQGIFEIFKNYKFYYYLLL